MIKYKPDTVAVVFSEIPDEVTLAVEITNCPGHCVGCHSPWLREDIGEELTVEKLRDIIDRNIGVTCVCFMGEGKDREALKKLAFSIKLRSDYPYKTALYSGREEIEDEMYKQISNPHFDENQKKEIIKSLKVNSQNVDLSSFDVGDPRGGRSEFSRDLMDLSSFSGSEFNSKLKEFVQKHLSGRGN